MVPLYFSHHTQPARSIDGQNHHRQTSSRHQGACHASMFTHTLVVSLSQNWIESPTAMQLRIASFAFLLSVAPTASTVQIRKAYFCLRSDIYQTLQPSDENNAFNNNLPLPNRQQVVLTKEEKRSASSIRCRIIRAMFDLRKFICGCRGGIECNLAHSIPVDTFC